jgi:hypothetical protein
MCLLSRYTDKEAQVIADPENLSMILGKLNTPQKQDAHLALAILAYNMSLRKQIVPDNRSMVSAS